MHMRSRLIAAMILLAGCSSIIGSNDTTTIGVIEGLHAGEPEINVPANVSAGEEFTISIVTGWHNGCAMKGHTEVRNEGATVRVTPYDVVTEAPGMMCTQALQRFTHETTVRFDFPGTAKVVIRGRPSRGAPVVSNERDLEVR